MANEGSTPNVAYYRFHFNNGKAPVQVLAGSRQAAEDFVRARYGANFSFAGAGSKLPGYIDETAGASGDDSVIVKTEEPPVGPGKVPGGLERLFPRGAYERGLQRQGLNPEGIASEYFEEMYAPVAASFNIENVLRGGQQQQGADLENAFQDWTAGTPIGGMRQRATNAFKTISNPGAAPNKDAQEFFQRYADPYGVSSGAPDEDAVNELIALAGQAAGTKYTPFTARRFLPGGNRVKERYQRGGLEGSFLDHLKRQYGLSTGGY